jgi:hypothetical protein
MKMTDPRFTTRIKDVQLALGFRGADVDGKIGHETLSLIEDLVLPESPKLPIVQGDSPATPKPAPAGGGGEISPLSVDARSVKSIATLEAKARPLFERIVIEGTRIAKSMGATGYVMISGNRTYAEQTALYAKGRTAPGPVVTNAKAGYSNHNFAVAGDFGVFSGADYLDNTNPALASKIHKAVAAWVKANLLQIAWGGDWTSFRDEPHYEYKTGLTLAQMRERVAAGQSVIG